jgi:hypothetical protein
MTDSDFNTQRSAILSTYRFLNVRKEVELLTILMSSNANQLDLDIDQK